MIKYRYNPGGIDANSIYEFAEQCDKPKKKRQKRSKKQDDHSKKLADEHGLQNQPKKKRQEIAKKGGETPNKRKRSDAKCEDFRERFSYLDFDIMLEFLPGEIRHERPLPCGYGHIRKYKGADGMALDCYVSKELIEGNAGCRNEDIPMFKITQVKEDGSYDEDKIMIGWNTMELAKRAYLNAMPSRFYGGITYYDGTTEV